MVPVTKTQQMVMGQIRLIVRKVIKYIDYRRPKWRHWIHVNGEDHVNWFRNSRGAGKWLAQWWREDPRRMLRTDDLVTRHVCLMSDKSFDEMPERSIHKLIKIKEKNLGIKRKKRSRW